MKRQITYCGHILRSMCGSRPFCDTPGTLNPVSAGNTGSNSRFRIQLWVIFSTVGYIFSETCIKKYVFICELYLSDIFAKYNLNNAHSQK